MRHGALGAQAVPRPPGTWAGIGHWASDTQEVKLHSQAAKLWAGDLASAKHSCGKNILEVSVAQARLVCFLQNILHQWTLQLAVRGLVLADAVQFIQTTLIFFEHGPHMARTLSGEPPTGHARNSEEGTSKKMSTRSRCE